MRISIALLLVLIFASSCSNKEEARTKLPVRVATEVVQVCTDLSSRSYVGIVEESEATAVSFTGMGVVKRVLVSEGQAVSRGQLLAEMDDTQARSMLSAAEAAMTQANDALQRYSMLHEAGSLPEVQWVEIQSKVAQAESQLAMARKNLSDCRLTAPVSGIIGRKLVSAGETALPSQAVVSIFNIGTVKVKVAIPEAEISSISSDTPSTVSVEAVGQDFTGGRIEKGVQADALTHTYDIRISVANTGRQLLPGMVAAVRFAATESQPTEQQATLPVTAVQRRADGSLFVWTAGPDSAAHRTAVTIGHTSGNRIAITSGVEAGQRVITEGYQKLSEGTRVVY
ncbi:MAG: efflux RND transporter periplasmic adaptor subunit [Prevotella sp.]|nr:efflux RND transporter periplasmic adaptor subunit [Prevotella sp.]